MAVLEKIRERTVLVLVMIGIGMFGFLFMGSDQSSIFSCSSEEKNYIGSVYGEEIEDVLLSEEMTLVEELNKWMIEARTGVQKPNLFSFASENKSDHFKMAWNNILEEKIIMSIAEEIGLAVTPKEQNDLETGEFNIALLDNDIQNLFQDTFYVPNQQTGQNDTNIGVRKQQVLWIRSNLESGNIGRGEGQLTEEWKTRYLAINKNAKRNRLIEKYKTLIELGMYTTTLEKNRMNKYQKSDIKYVSIPYDEESDLKVTDKEIKEYYENHILDFQNDKENRTIEIVRFSTNPNELDSLNIKNQLDKISEDFYQADDDEVFSSVTTSLDDYLDFSNYDDPLLYDTSYQIVNDEDSENSFRGDKNIEEIFYQERKIKGYYIDGRYRLTKIVEEPKDFQNEMQARHILLKKEDFPSDSADFLINEIKEKILDGEDFGKLASEYSGCQSSTRGGNLGWFLPESMVPEFSKTCDSSEVGDLSIVSTEFGVHLVQVLQKGRKKYKVVSIDKEIKITKETKDISYSTAKKFMTAATSRPKEVDFKSFSKNEYNIDAEEYSSLMASDYDIIGLDNSRRILQWAFNANEGDISQKVFRSGNDNIIVNLLEVKLKGDKSLISVREKIKKIILEEKQFSNITNKIPSDFSIDKIAEIFNVEVKVSEDVNFLNTNNQELPNTLFGVVNATSASNISSAFEGEEGVFVIYVVNKKDIGKSNNDQGDIKSRKKKESVIKFLKKEADVISKLYYFGKE